MRNHSEKTTGTASASTPTRARILLGLPLIALMHFLTIIAAPSIDAQAGRAAAPSRPNDQVISLIARLAEQAHLSCDIQFAVRAQAQAGLLIWPYDRDQARAILRRAFHQLLPSASHLQTASALERAKRQQLGVEFLNQIALSDPEMAETLARAFVLSKKVLMDEQASLATTDGAPWLILPPGPVEAESRELLVSVALRVAQADRARAAALGQLSLESGISPHFDHLLLLIGETDPALADRLFSKAVDYLDRTMQVSPGDAHTLSFYLISSVAASDKDSPAQAAIIRFLNLAFDVVMRHCPVNQSAALRNATDQSFEIYCAGKYLMELLPRYLPDRAAQLQRRLSELDDRKPSSAVTGKSAAQSIDPFVTEQAARDSADARERDLLYARAAIGWLGCGDLREVERTATNITNAQVRDRVALQVAQRLLSKARFRDAMLIARLIEDKVAKTELIVRLAQAAISLRNTSCAKTLLDLAELEATKIEAPVARARARLAIAAVFSAFDSSRAFAVMQEAVKSANETPARELQVPGFEQEVFHQSLANSVTALARLDFDRALLLSEQLTDKQASLIAQLAVCRGGLRPDGSQKR